MKEISREEVAEDMYKALKSASSYISQNNPHWSAPYHNETTREIIEAISKYEQLKE
jgi:NTP pyrophosphatase (non-canonical NTP hydrolase)